MAATSHRANAGRAVSRRERPGLDVRLRLRSIAEETENGLVSWCAAAGRKVLHELFEADVVALCGERWKPNPRAKVARAGWCNSEITLGGKRISVRRPRVRSRRGREIELPSFQFAAERDPLDRLTVEEIAVAVSSASSSVLPQRRDRIVRSFVEMTTAQLLAPLDKPRSDTSPCLLVHGVPFRDHWMLVAIGVSRGGTKQLVGLRAGSPDNAEAVYALLADLIDPVETTERPVILVVGEEPGIREAVRKHFNRSVVVHRCPAAKRRRVLGLLPPERQPAVLETMFQAYAMDDATLARRSLQRLAQMLQREFPRAAHALRDGLEETLTLSRLGLSSRGVAAAVRPTRPARVVARRSASSAR